MVTRITCLVWQVNFFKQTTKTNGPTPKFLVQKVGWSNCWNQQSKLWFRWPNYRRSSLERYFQWLDCQMPTPVHKTTSLVIGPSRSVVVRCLWQLPTPITSDAYPTTRSPALVAIAKTPNIGPLALVAEQSHQPLDHRHKSTEWSHRPSDHQH